MGGLAFKFVGFAACLFAILYMAATAFRNSRKLDSRIKQFKKEQEDLAMRAGPIDPYAALSDLYNEKNDKDKRDYERPATRGKR